MEDREVSETTCPTRPGAPFRRQAYTFLIIISLATAFARIMSADGTTLSANDRSRWATVRALGDHGTFAIGRREPVPDGQFTDNGIVTEHGWQTVDVVLHPDTGEFYSSKPPLLPVLVAGEYCVIRSTVGWRITERRWWVQRATLLATNWLPLAAYLLLLVGLIERFGTTDWGRLYLVVVGCFGTFVTTFSGVLNNHTPAACAALFALYAAVRASDEAPGRPASWRWHAVAGFAAGFAAAVEFPAAALTAVLGWRLARQRPASTLCGYLPAALVPLGVLMLTNYLALGQIRPAYAEFGSPWYEFPGSYWNRAVVSGIDAAGQSETKAEYAAHLVYGHHGLFSLTPVFLLTVAAVGLGTGAASLRAAIADLVVGRGPVDLRVLGGLAAVLTTVVLGFYIFTTSNYGGITCGPRWLLWLTPLLLLAAVPAADACAASPLPRRAAYGLLAVSVFSATYPVRTPWSNPWLYDLLVTAGWLDY